MPFGRDVWEALRAQARIAVAGYSALRELPAILRALDQMWQMATQGGILVQTPVTGDALLATLIQPDGDVMLSVSDALLDPGRDDERKRLLVRHSARVAATMAPLQQLVRNGRAIDALLLLVHQYLRSGAAVYAPGAAFNVFGSFSTAGLFGSAGGFAAMAALPWFLRRQAGRFIRWRIRQRLDALRETTHEAHARLTASRQPPS